jgi:hypothetical protein
VIKKSETAMLRAASQVYSRVVELAIPEPIFLFRLPVTIKAFAAKIPPVFQTLGKANKE